MSQEETNTPQINSGQINPAVLSDFGSKGKTRFWDNLVKLGAAQKDLEMISDFMLPVISDFVFFKTVGELGNETIEAIDTEVTKRGAGEDVRALAIDKAYEKKTGRSMQQEILEFLDSLADSLDEMKETVEAVVNQALSEETDDEDREKKLNELFEKIIEEKFKELNNLDK